MKIQSFFVLVLAQQFIVADAAENFGKTKLYQNSKESQLSRNLERSLYGLNATREISLQDVSHKINEFISNRKLNMISQSNSDKSNHYLLQTPKGKEMNLNVQKNKNGFKVNLNQRELALKKSLQIGSQNYSLNQVGHFLHDQLENIKKAERRLTDGQPYTYTKSEWKKLIDDTFKKILTEDKKEYKLVVIGNESDQVPNFEVQTKDGKELISLTISDEKKENIERKILRLSNIHKEQYKDNHSKYERRIIEADTDTEIEQYLQQTIKEIGEAEEQYKNVLINRIYEFINTKQNEKQGKKMVFEQIEKDKVYNVKFEDQDIGYMNIYEIDDQYFGLSIKLKDRAFSTKLPKSELNFNKAMEQFTKELDNFEGLADNGQSPLITIEFKDAVDKVMAQIATICKELPEEDFKYDNNAYNLSLGKDDLKNKVSELKMDQDLECIFARSTIIIELISTGYFQYIHLYLDLKIMKTEYMIGLNKATFDERLTGVIQEIEEKVKVIKESQENADEDVNLSLQEIKTVFDDAIKKNADLFNCGEIQEDKYFICTYIKSESMCAMITSTENQIIVNLMDNYRDLDGDTQLESNPSFNFQKRNGYDQMDSFKEDLDKFLKKQAKRKLMKKELI